MISLLCNGVEVFVDFSYHRHAFLVELTSKYKYLNDIFFSLLNNKQHTTSTIMMMRLRRGPTKKTYSKDCIYSNFMNIFIYHRSSKHTEHSSHSMRTRQSKKFLFFNFQSHDHQPSQKLESTFPSPTTQHQWKQSKSIHSAVRRHQTICQNRIHILSIYSDTFFFYFFCQGGNREKKHSTLHLSLALCR